MTLLEASCKGFEVVSYLRKKAKEQRGVNNDNAVLFEERADAVEKLANHIGGLCANNA